jgi:putative ABC transport system permease protein
MLLVNLKEAVRSLMAAKQRSLLALIGVVIGIASVMAMLGIGETVKSQAMEKFKAMGVDILTIRGSGFGGDSDAESYRLTVDDLDRLARYSHYIKAISPEVQAWSDVTAGPAKIDANLVCVREVYKRVNKLKLVSGRFLRVFDDGKAHAVLGDEVARKLESQGAKGPIKEILIKGLLFQVVGRLAPANLGYRSSQVDQAIMLPLDMAPLVGANEGVSRAMVLLEPDTDHEEATKEINDFMGCFNQGKARIMIDSPRQLLDNMASQMRLYTLLLAAVGGISLVVGGVGIMNMMLASVTERRKEIGIRRSLGAQRRDIVGQFLVESTILSLLGGLLGAGLGAGATYGVAWFEHWKPLIPTYAVLLSVGVAAAVGIFFGFFPSHRAARMDVIEALRRE